MTLLAVGWYYSAEWKFSFTCSSASYNSLVIWATVGRKPLICQWELWKSSYSIVVPRHTDRLFFDLLSDSQITYKCTSDPWLYTTAYLFRFQKHTNRCNFLEARSMQAIQSNITHTMVNVHCNTCSARLRSQQQILQLGVLPRAQCWMQLTASVLTHENERTLPQDLL